MLTAAVLHAQGMSQVVVVDIDEAKLGIVKTLGFATGTFLSPRKAPSTHAPDIAVTLADARTLATTICEQFGQPGFDRVYECTGAPSCVQAAIYVGVFVAGKSDGLVSLLISRKQASLPGGKVVLVGMGTAVQTLPIAAAALREVDIIGVFRYANAYPTAIRMIVSGRLPGIERLITHRRVLQEGASAFLLALDGKDGDGQPVLKAVITN